MFVHWLGISVHELQGSRSAYSIDKLLLYVVHVLHFYVSFQFLSCFKFIYLSESE